jgi:hypothetical protein
LRRGTEKAYGACGKLRRKAAMTAAIDDWVWRD